MASALGEPDQLYWLWWSASPVTRVGCRGESGQVAGALRSAVTGNRMRHVRSLQRSDFLGVELQLQRRHRVMQMLRPGCADDGCGGERLLGNPGQCHLCAGNMASFGNHADGVDDALVGLGCAVERLAIGVAGLALAVRLSRRG